MVAAMMWPPMESETMAVLVTMLSESAMMAIVMPRCMMMRPVMMMMLVLMMQAPPPFPPVHSEGRYAKKGPRAALRTLYRLYLSLVWISGSKTCIFAKAPHQMQAPSVF